MTVHNTKHESHHTWCGTLVKNKQLVIVIWIMVIVILGCCSYFYWYHRNHDYDAMIKLTDSWEQINAAINEEPADQRELAAAQHFANSNKNTYGALTSMALARHYAKIGNFATAEKQLQQALTQTSEINLQSLINLRLARLQLQQNNINGALITIDVVKKQHRPGWIALAEDLCGYTYVVKGDYSAARDAYEKALNTHPSPPMLQALVMMKLHNLPPV